MQEEHQPFVIFMPSGRRRRVPVGTPLLEAARDLGIEIESICGGKLTCGKCLVQVEEGEFAKHGIHSSAASVSPPSADEQTLVARKQGGTLRCACVATVQSDALIFVPEESRAHKQTIRKAATDRLIEIDPTVCQRYVEVDSAELGEHRGDWGRLQTALAQQWQLNNLTIDLYALRQLQATLRRGQWKVTITLWQNREVIDVRAGYDEGCYGLAVDLGSTTVAAHLCNLRTGQLLATESVMNPQISYGEDLMSRVSYAMTNPDGTNKMHKAMIEALNKLATQITQQVGLTSRDIHDAVFVGNTTMAHLFLGIDPSELGGAPFALATRDAVDLKARELGLKFHKGAYLHLLPAEAGHVGADNVAVILAEEPQLQEQLTLVVDVGTNAEIVLGNRQILLSASSPTGPAFEGAQIAYGMRAAPGAIERVRIDPLSFVANFRVIGEERWSAEWDLSPSAEPSTQASHLAAGICGSGIIEVVAEMFRVGIIRGDGRFNSALTEHPRVQWEGRKGRYVLATAQQTTNGEPIFVTQDDIRNIQLAKAALYAGCKLLLRRANVTQVERIVLAGAFGSYIDPRYAMLLGLIPDCALENVTAVGNAAGDGARIALLNQAKRSEAQRLARAVTYVETAVDPAFQEEFVGAIHIPHAQDRFPHLGALLPVSAENGEGESAESERRSRRRRTTV